ncbi:NAD(P)-binding domain-containing protein [Demequina sp. B12]|uniref:flavin-containing monooxygenase n=1 Tax=Demequina sp. B12 TaxID=2992757 RepID=UPI00237C3CEB|nr:NAD(P)-binding domain-containing protein [Demequina sp. B12]MDE0573478.1 NAD(P)-binding domain-containing protein [Demequina sp. B12]
MADATLPTTLIIGAGPAGLAAARALKEHDLPYDQVERHHSAGGLWDIENPGSPMYESAHFISSKTLSNFHGFPMPEGYPDYPSHRQILAYLQAFADHYGLTERITFGTTVTKVTRTKAGRYTVTFTSASAGDTAAGARTQRTYDQVIAASGVQWDPTIIEVPGFTGEVRHSVTYRDPSEFTGRRVLIVGAGNSGCDIACDAARTADHAEISMRRGYWFIPKHIFGMPVDVFAQAGPTLPMSTEQAVFGRMLRIINGDVTRLGLQEPDHKLFETHPILNDQLLHYLGHGDITARPAIASANGSTVTFTDGTTEDFDLILLATGYRHTVPYAQDLFGDPQHPDLYLTAFSRNPGLYGLGFVETNSGAYRLMDMLAHMVASHIWDRHHRADAWAAFERHVAEDSPDLSGGIRFVDSPRHQGYVDSHAMQRYLRMVAKRMGWELP